MIEFLGSIWFLIFLRRPICHLKWCLRPLLNYIIFIVIICNGWLHIISKISLKLNLGIIRIIKFQFLLKRVANFLNKLELLIGIRFIQFIIFSKLSESLKCHEFIVHEILLLNTGLASKLFIQFLYTLRRSWFILTSNLQLFFE